MLERIHRRMFGRLGGVPACVRHALEEKRKIELHAVMFMGYGGAAPFVVDAADFDGTNDYLSRANLSGIADSKIGIMSFWVLYDTISSMQYVMGNKNSGGTEFAHVRLSSDTINFYGQLDYVGGTATTCRKDSIFSTGTWYHCLWTWDTDQTEELNINKLYVNDASQSLTQNSGNNQLVEYDSLSLWTIGANAFNQGNKLDGALAELYFAPGQWMDITVEANRRKFISASGKPVSLGSDGSTPTGTAPKIYLHLDDGESAANFATNRGSGGNFTVTGALTTRASSPSD